MWELSNPVYAWGLLSLGIPIVIHLFNRRQTKVKVLGTLRWLQESKPARWNFRYIHQWPLLCIRLLLFVVVVLLLMNLYKTDADKTPARLRTLILIHPAAGDTTQYRQLANGWQNDSVRVRWLAPLFPPANESTGPFSYYHVPSLLTEADSRFAADSIHVIAPNQGQYFAGAPAVTKAALSWELTDKKADTTWLLSAREWQNEPELVWFSTNSFSIKYATQTSLQHSLHQDAQITWQKQTNSVLVSKADLRYEVPLHPNDTLTISPVALDKWQKEWQLWQGVMQALAGYHRVALKFTEEQNSQTDWLINFSGDTTVSQKKGGLIIRYAPGLGNQWIEPAGTNVLILRKNLSTGQVLGGGLFRELRPYLLTFKFAGVSPQQTDFRKVDAVALSSGKNGTMSFLFPYADIHNNSRLWLGLLAFILITLERLWPKVKN